MFAEQDYNSGRIHSREHGIRLEITTVTQSQLKHAINLILNDPKYFRCTQPLITHLFFY